MTDQASEGANLHDVGGGDDEDRCIRRNRAQVIDRYRIRDVPDLSGQALARGEAPKPDLRIADDVKVEPIRAGGFGVDRGVMSNPSRLYSSLDSVCVPWTRTSDARSPHKASEIRSTWAAVCAALRLHLRSAPPVGVAGGSTRLT